MESWVYYQLGMYHAPTIVLLDPPSSVAKTPQRQLSISLPPCKPFLHRCPLHFFWPFLLFEPPALEVLDATLDAREGEVELALLDLTLSNALFCDGVSY
jgi:hypothetical protein